jgi:hypothetical protein
MHDDRMSDEELIEAATATGAQLYERSPGVWGWKWGMRTSADQYAKTFIVKADAAAHWLGTRECDSAKQAKSK